MYLVTWNVRNRRVGQLMNTVEAAHEDARDIAGFEGVSGVSVSAFDTLDVSRVAVPVEEHDRILAAKDAQIAALEARMPRDPLMRVCVVGLVTDRAKRILLIFNRTRQGLELPGGKLHAGETWRDALRREMKEETGLDVDLSAGNPEVLDGVPLPGAAYASIIIVAHCRAEGEPTPGDDAQEALWFAPDEIPWDKLSRIGSAEVVKRWASSVKACPNGKDSKKCCPDCDHSAGACDGCGAGAPLAAPRPVYLVCPGEPKPCIVGSGVSTRERACPNCGQWCVPYPSASNLAAAAQDRSRIGDPIVRKGVRGAGE